jgi:hypothetical protein
MFGVVIIVFIIIIYIYTIKLAHPNYKIVTFDEVKDKIKTGDMVLFSSLDSINQIFMISYYTHVGIVYKDGDNPPMLIEAFNPCRMPFYPKEFEAGVAVCDLEHRFNSYRGYILYKELTNPVSEESISDLKEFIEYARLHFKYDKDVIVGEIGKMLFNTPFSHKTNCGQLTVLILIKLGLIDFDHFTSRQKHHLRWTAKLKHLKNNSYKEPVYIYSQYFKIPEFIH